MKTMLAKSLIAAAAALMSIASANAVSLAHAGTTDSARVVASQDTGPWPKETSTWSD